MNLAETFRGLIRRWYIVLPGILLAAVAGVYTWSVTEPAYERTATQILLPGMGTLPEEATNPYLYLGGLPSAADVIVRAVGAEDALRDIVEEHPGSEVEVTRDPTTSGPVILIKVTAPSDAAAGQIIAEMVQRTATIVADLQGAQGVPADDAITVTPIAVDQVSQPQQRDRIVLSAAVAAGGILLVLLIASAVDGLVTRSRRDGRGGRGGPRDGHDDALVHDEDDALTGAGPIGARDGSPEPQVAAGDHVNTAGSLSEPKPKPEPASAVEDRSAEDGDVWSTASVAPSEPDDDADENVEAPSPTPAAPAKDAAAPRRPAKAATRHKSRPVAARRG
ncbi:MULTISPECIES: hypothetical protein [Microbacterium]|uniref:Capsular polysaccharide biosynthesis protein n=1 Tax=Microbacterium wangchenii TaxID=2541726 RepID=A0ABX5SSH3_9MICO|nr:MULTISPECIES: hypothetical protein [Microbacterium]MCK6068069.1 hypothetical protein [Microbacterium sp. EYE_512]QBR87804.1 hypothetical protein E4K62_03275 [Microbacterium wangchenii]TXK16097.1 hypothetical protein FVP99_11510 [Microbacterium wangchenii]